jgi:hypothetical protein
MILVSLFLLFYPGFNQWSTLFKVKVKNMEVAAPSARFCGLYQTELIKEAYEV